ncbi:MULTISPECIES: MarR family transcriptional regulator [Bacillus]|jgi:DNA-binding MarR family transcriptional regulator|uniref:HTH-type transcriptional regulator SarZ n=2 Tax=Bacillus mojavensis subgroup TaxID=653388 RepID=A0AAP3CN04_BACMO|nr:MULTISPECIES: MarR family transcriptional regulator [Bacillus]KUP32315.1 MarR family transcriptional regulator [Bacillus halotolerans]MBL6006949.1 MarR family transcriptional regulator [Bacillus halotolerans]MBU5247987.1 MarR family transcriptional regulator [Bacillus halotolerans]MBV5124200.1 MarR family transcriptional regulator [Bacillus halotolerans]MCC2117524.1 MarR family transcriptional regulator [Bacillus halotolerans]
MELDFINKLNQQWTDIYYSLHYKQKDNISHQAIRLMQHIEKQGEATIGALAEYLSVSHNTASEHTKRLIQKGLAAKRRSQQDERKVLVVLTKEGRSVLEQHTQLDKEKLKEIIERISSSEKELIQQAFEILSKEAKQWR